MENRANYMHACRDRKSPDVFHRWKGWRRITEGKCLPIYLMSFYLRELSSAIPFYRQRLHPPPLSHHLRPRHLLPPFHSIVVVQQGWECVARRRYATGDCYEQLLLRAAPAMPCGGTCGCYEATVMALLRAYPGDAASRHCRLVAVDFMEHCR